MSKVLVNTSAGVKPIGSDPGLQSNVTVDSSNKSFTVPAGKIWEIEWLYVTLITTATVGNRQLQIEILKADNTVLAAIPVGIVQAASLTRNYLLAEHLPDLTAFRNTAYLMTPMPKFTLSAGMKVKIYDIAAIAAAADDMNIQMMVDELNTAV